MVTIQEAGARTQHEVRLCPATWPRLQSLHHDPAQIVRAAFCFLLEREPAAAILPRFDLREISRYFPEFEQELPRYLTAAAGN
ncbi:MAG: hypothetical protein A3H91_07485 [Gammaproteobacteria bacterium RIFCSPLOWO2_02_FULL_61_13]|nr:MAG: hypothetical protein A3H91_07485 [Gammaproteobacteria bacterium RIFCSPLOWO2_02_FULL_61_13]